MNSSRDFKTHSSCRRQLTKTLRLLLLGKVLRINPKADLPLVRRLSQPLDKPAKDETMMAHRTFLVIYLLFL